MIRLTVEQAASLLGISERAVRKNATNGAYGEVTYEEGLGRGGRNLRIPLTGLPAKAQAMYWSAKAETPAVNDDLAGLTDEEREDVGNKQRILAAWRQYREANKGSGNARQIDQRFVRMWTSVYKDKLSVATLHRWDKTQREQGAKALADKRGKARAGESSIPDDLWAIYEAEYMNQNKRTHMECYKLVRTSPACTTGSTRFRTNRRFAVGQRRSSTATSWCSCAKVRKPGRLWLLHTSPWTAPACLRAACSRWITPSST